MSDNPFVMSRRTVLAAATGVYSDIRIRGSEGRRNFRVRVTSARVQKVLDAVDPCAAILGQEP